MPVSCHERVETRNNHVNEKIPKSVNLIEEKNIFLLNLHCMYGGTS